MILVTGTGNSGTSVLLDILKELGYSFRAKINGVEANETHEIIRNVMVSEAMRNDTPIEWPEVIKHCGGFCYHLSEYIEKYKWDVDHVFITVRHPVEFVKKRTLPDWDKQNPKSLGIDRNVWNLLPIEEKRQKIREKIDGQIGSAIHECLKSGVDFSLIEYPRFCRDFDYAFEKINPVTSTTLETLFKAWTDTIDPERVHNYD